MSRVIDDITYAEIVKILAQDPKVAAFQKLILSPKLEATDEPAAADSTETKSEVKEK